jgi:phosphoribosylglycinamide formyltransferase-1
MPMNEARFPIAVLISGGGTTLKNLIDRIATNQLSVEIRLVISSNPRAGGLSFAKEAGIPSSTIERQKHGSPEAYRDAVFAAVRAADVELVVMAGFLKHLLIPSDFAGRVINIHPSLIPDFCGAGFYGKRVHEAVLAAGVTKTGCTVHIVDDEYDHGPIVRQRSVDVEPTDTADALAARVFAQECELLPEVLQLFAAGSILVDDNGVRVCS